MSKEKEDRQYYQDVVDTLNDNDMVMEANEMVELMDIIFNTPTSEEVCQALSESIGHQVEYSKHREKMFHTSC